MAVSNVLKQERSQQQQQRGQRQRQSVDTVKAQTFYLEKNRLESSGVETTDLASSQQKDHQASHLNDKNILYVNIRIRNVAEAVKERVTKKLERAVVIPNVVIDKAAQRASNMTSPKAVAEALSQIICKIFPEELKKKGITAIVDEVFRESTFFVLQIRVLHVDPITLAASWFSGGGISWFLQTIGADNRKYFEDDYLPSTLTSVLVEYVPTLLQERMSDKKIEADTEVLKAEDQAAYFFSKLSQVRQEDKQRGSTMKKFRRAFSSMSASSGVGGGGGGPACGGSTNTINNRGICGRRVSDYVEEDLTSLGSLSRTSSTFSSALGSL